MELWDWIEIGENRRHKVEERCDLFVQTYRSSLDRVKSIGQRLTSDHCGYLMDQSFEISGIGRSGSELADLCTYAGVIGYVHVGREA